MMENLMLEFTIKGYKFKIYDKVVTKDIHGEPEWVDYILKYNNEVIKSLSANVGLSAGSYWFDNENAVINELVNTIAPNYVNNVLHKKKNKDNDIIKKEEETIKYWRRYPDEIKLEEEYRKAKRKQVQKRAKPKKRTTKEIVKSIDRVGKQTVKGLQRTLKRF